MNLERIRVCVLLAVFAALAAANAAPTPLRAFITSVDYLAVDRFVSWNPCEPPSDVLILDVDDRSHKAPGTAYAFGNPLRLRGDLLEILATGDPKAVAMTLPGISFFPSDTVPKGAGLLGRTVIAGQVDTDAVPKYGLTQDERLGQGFVPRVPDTPAKIDARAFLCTTPIRIDADGMARRAGAGDMRDAVLGIVGRSAPPGQIRFCGPYRTVRTIPLWRVLARNIPPSEWTGKIVIVGASASAVRQIVMTPIGAMPESEAVAQAISSALAGKDIRRAALGVSIAALAALAALVVLAGRRPTLAGRMTIVAGSGLAYLALVWTCLHSGSALPIFTGAALVASGLIIHLASFYIEQILRERFLASSFTRFLSRPVAERIIKAGGHLPEPRRKRITVLFADIRGFTAYSETKTPEDVARALNMHFAEMIEKVFKHGGTLDKLLGDCVMAFWGDPEETPDTATRAVACAEEMRTDWKKLSQIHFGDAAERVGIGIGLECGEAIVGNVGTEEFLDYTVVGDIVNVASRLVDQAKAGQIFLGPGLVEQTGNGNRLEYVGEVSVRGRTAPVKVWSLP